MTESEYMERMVALYKKEEDEKIHFLDRYYPIDPFDGAWVKASDLDPQIITRAFCCQKQIERCNLESDALSQAKRFKPDQKAVQNFASSLAEMPLIRVSQEWLKARKEHIKAVIQYAALRAENNEEETQNLFYEASGKDNQLLSYYYEVEEAYWLTVAMSNAEVEGE